MKHLEVREKYSAARRIFNSLLISVFHLVMKHCVLCLIYDLNYLSHTLSKGTNLYLEYQPRRR